MMTTKTEKKPNKPKIRKTLTYRATALPPEGTVRLPTVIACLGISKNAFTAGIKAGIFPAGTLLTPRIRVWHVADIRKFLASLENPDEGTAGQNRQA
jgi:prophage regulatory protein